MKADSTGKAGKTTTLWLLLLAIFIAECFTYTWSRVQCVTTGYQISRASKERKEALTVQKRLKVELAHLNSPARIGKIAKQRLGLTMPRPEQVVVIK